MAYAETTRSRPRDKRQHEDIIQTVGVALNESDTGLPGLGDFIDSETDLVTGHICQHVRYDPTLHSGRLFVYATWIGLRDAT